MLEVRDLCGSIRGISLEGISFLVEKGDFWGIFGPDDSGKTELLFFLMGLGEADSGDVLYGDGNIIRKEFLKNVRYVPDQVLAEEGITALRYLKQIGKAYKNWDAARAEELVVYFGVDLSEKLTAMTYEGNKLVTIIGALMTEPKLLILDEPFNFLTEEASCRLMEFLAEKNRQGMTIVVTAEKYRLVEGYVDRFLYLKDGRVISQGSVEELPRDMKAVTVSHENMPEESRKMAECILGKPVRVDGAARTYLCEHVGGKLAALLGQCEIGGDDILIEKVPVEEALEAEWRRDGEKMD